MSERVRKTQRSAMVFAALAAALSIAGCATPGAGDAAHTTSAPTTTPPPQLPSTTPEPSVPTAETATLQLADACLAAVRQDNAPASEQLDRSKVGSDRARSALRPDGLWYVVVPVEDPTVDAALEYACLLTADLEADTSWARIAPEVDDFVQWATATEPDEGL